MKIFVPSEEGRNEVSVSYPGEEKRWIVCRILEKITPSLLVPNCVNVFATSTGIGYVSPDGVDFTNEEKDILEKWTIKAKKLDETAAFIINRMGRGMEQLLEHCVYGEVGQDLIQLLGVSIMVCLAGRLIDDDLWVPLTRRFSLHERTMAVASAYLEDRVEIGNMMTFGERSYLSRLPFERCGVFVVEQPPMHDESVEEITTEETVEMGEVEIVEVE